MGGAGDDAITGNAADNRLDGGAGADSMAGGLGDDTYVVDNIGDIIVEQAGQGSDTVLASIGWRLGGGLESLVLTGSEAGNGSAMP